MTLVEDAVDLAYAEKLREGLGGALTVDDILTLRAAGIWHRIQWDLRSEREDGVSGRQKAPVISPEQKQALRVAGWPQRPAREAGDRDYILDSKPVQPWLDRAEVATGYLFSLHGVAATGQPASYPFFEAQPALGPVDVMTVWHQVKDARAAVEKAAAVAATIRATALRRSEDAWRDV